MAEHHVPQKSLRAVIVLPAGGETKPAALVTAGCRFSERKSKDSGNRTPNPPCDEFNAQDSFSFDVSLCAKLFVV